MEFIIVLMTSLAFFLNFSHCAVVLRQVSDVYLPYAYQVDGVTGLYGINKDALEQIAYDADTGIVYAAGAAYIHIVDYSNVTNPVILKNVAITGNGEINDIEMCGDKVAFALQGAANNQPGQIHVYNLYDNETGNFQMLYRPLIVGYTPDMLHFTKDCKTIVVANEASGYHVTDTQVVDPEGAVSIIKFQQGVNPPVVTSVNFTRFNDRADEYVAKGVRWPYKGEISWTPSSFSQSLEPEYVAYNADESKVYIGLQENNAIAELDMISMTITELYPLGVKSWRDLLMDGSDKDSGLNLQRYNISSFLQPDSIYHFEHNGVGYIVTANEGESVEYKGRTTWSDTKRGRKLVKDGHLATDVDPDLRAALGDDARLGRLEFSIVDGLSLTEPTKVASPHFHGGRGISIFRASDMSLVWDSGDLIAKKHAEFYPRTFNGNTKPDDPSIDTPEALMDKRSDNQGAECETLALGQLDDGTRLLFLGVGRASSVVVFQIGEGSNGDPQLEFQSVFRAGGTNATFDFLLENRNVGNLDPEDMKFISSSESFTGQPLLLVAGTTSGTLVMYEVVNEDDNEVVNEDDTSGGEGFHNLTTSSTLIIGLAGLIISRIWK